MKEKTIKYLDDLYSSVPTTKQLLELKEEIGTNLLEKIKELMKFDSNQEEAPQKAISSLGDMREFIDDLKKGAEKKNPQHSQINHQQKYGSHEYYQELDKKHIIGFVAATALVLFGALLGGSFYLRINEILTGILLFTPFALISVMAFIYLGLTLDGPHDYPMNDRPAFMYSISF